ncbi:MAG TPA: type II secretion system F family protein [Caulifigura sp.]|nr:type II secretion system F family protein [Caulifigura sp.]
MTIHFTAKARDGSVSSGVLDLASIADARKHLVEKGLYPVKLSEAIIPAVAQAKARSSLFGSRIRKTDILMATCQLAVMTKAKIDLAEALRNVSEHCPHVALKKTLTTVYDDVVAGKSLSAALSRQSNVFGDPYVSSVAAAEASGTIAESLHRLTELLRNEIRLRGSVTGALMYPAALIGVAGLVIVALFMFVLPQFADVFNDLGGPPPPATQMLLAISGALRGNLLVVAGVLVGIAIAVRTMLAMPKTVEKWHSFQLNNAILRRASRPLLIGQAFRRLATMLQTGVPLLDALRLSKKSVRNVLYQKLFVQMADEVEAGRGLSTTLSLAPFLPPGAAQMVRTAESSGKLGEVLETVGSFYEEEGERELRQVVKLLEPVIVVVMGVIVACVVAAVILPLLDVSSMAK